MAVETRIDSDDEWFVGEDRLIRFTVSGDTDGIELWNMIFELFPRRAVPGDVPVLEAPVSGTGATPTAPPRAIAAIDGDDTVAIGPGFYQFVLSRTDPGARAVLAFGPVELRSAVNA